MKQDQCLLESLYYTATDFQRTWHKWTHLPEHLGIVQIFFFFSPLDRTKKGSRNVSITLSLFRAGVLERVDKPAAFKSNKKASKTKFYGSIFNILLRKNIVTSQGGRIRMPCIPETKQTRDIQQPEFITKQSFLLCCFSLLSSGLDDALPCNTIENDKRKTSCLLLW